MMGRISQSIVSDDKTFLSQMLLQTYWGRGHNWKVRHLVDVSENLSELLGDDVLALVSGRVIVRKVGEAKTCTTDNPDDAVKKYIHDCLNARDSVEALDVEVIVVEQKIKEFADFQVCWENGQIQGYYQASIVIKAVG